MDNKNLFRDLKNLNTNTAVNLAKKRFSRVITVLRHLPTANPVIFDDFELFFGNLDSDIWKKKSQGIKKSQFLFRFLALLGQNRKTQHRGRPTVSILSECLFCWTINLLNCCSNVSQHCKFQTASDLPISRWTLHVPELTENVSLSRRRFKLKKTVNFSKKWWKPCPIWVIPHCSGGNLMKTISSGESKYQ